MGLNDGHLIGALGALLNGHDIDQTRRRRNAGAGHHTFGQFDGKASAALRADLAELFPAQVRAASIPRLGSSCERACGAFRTRPVMPRSRAQALRRRRIGCLGLRNGGGGQRGQQGACNEAWARMCHAAPDPQVVNQRSSNAKRRRSKLHRRLIVSTSISRNEPRRSVPLPPRR
jgi:hypothetical protein